MSNASAHLLPEAGARDERTLEAVRCSAWLGAARTGTEPRLAFLGSPAFGPDTATRFADAHVYGCARLACVAAVVERPEGVSDVEAHELLTCDFVVHELRHHVLHRRPRVP
jgi:hypothetical protein